ncbi:MAG: 2-dehydropantoate 2-reductase [uncultured Thermomicrobiales bacterium]|uniref:2-dehydropantoate 2-reductase n=1 Tax=uncultured Thermomicrobiales bacterium TaxID=1645740 RepID=A0A6J4VS89_9BACT|nr:MAG: 2-dehydropantoate 2-reductase [uncultured Thermomicrobiales bacterium]
MAGGDLRGVPITIIGAGAIGGTVGAYLGAAGYDITLVDVFEEHVRAINERGLRITGIRGDRTFPVRAILADELRGPLGPTFLCVKGHFTAEAIGRYGPLLAADGYVVSLQNGLNEETIAREIGPERTVGAFVHFGADLLEPGIIQLGAEQTIYIGELDGRITPRAEAVRAALEAVMPARVTDNIAGFLWGKLVYGAMAFAASCVDAPVPAIIDDPLGRQVCQAASAEAYLVARTQAPRLEMIGEFDPNAFAPGEGATARGDAALLGLAGSMRDSPKQHMGIWRDLKVKRRRTEVDMQTAVLVAKGAELGIPTPVNAAVLDVIHEIESGQRGMEWSNLGEIAERASLVQPH